MDSKKSAVAIILFDTEVLVGQRQRSGALAFPGGYIKYGEKGYRAAARETLEETGVEVEMEKEPLNADPNDDILYYVGYYTGFGGPIDTREMKNVRWMTHGEALRNLRFNCNKYYLRMALEKYYGVTM